MNVLSFLTSRTKFFYFCIGAIVAFLSYYFMSEIGEKPKFPDININKFNPCEISENGNISYVENFSSNSNQYLCGEITTDTSPIHLTLYLYEYDKYSKSISILSANFNKNEITFHIEDKLPPGKYRAIVMYARKALADIYFDVEE